MCCSFLGQLIYGAVMIAALGLTLASMFSPGWTQIKGELGDITDDLKQHNIPDVHGIFPFLCSLPGGEKSSGGVDQCEIWFDNLPGWEKAVVVLMCLSVVVEVLAIIWTVITLCACCCKAFIIHPLPWISLLLTIFLAAAVIIFGIKNKDSIQVELDENLLNQLKLQGEVGYSFYLACGALAAAVIDIIVGGLTVTLAKRCC